MIYLQVTKIILTSISRVGKKSYSFTLEYLSPKGLLKPMEKEKWFEVKEKLPSLKAYPNSSFLQLKLGLNNCQSHWAWDIAWTTQWVCVCVNATLMGFCKYWQFPLTYTGVMSGWSSSLAQHSEYSYILPGKFPPGSGVTFPMLFYPCVSSPIFCFLNP